MNKITKLITLAAAIFALSFQNVSAQNFASNSSVSDRAIEQLVYKQILQLPRYSVFDFINFKVDNGTVTLDGKTISLGTRSSAANVVKRVPGVVSVNNNIDELPLSSFDDGIRRQLLRTFAANGLGRYFHSIRPDVRLIVDRGHVTLEGYVSSTGDLNAMNIHAHGIPGVFSVQNNLRVGTDLRR